MTNFTVEELTYEQIMVDPNEPEPQWVVEYLAWLSEEDEPPPLSPEEERQLASDLLDLQGYFLQWRLMAKKGKGKKRR